MKKGAGILLSAVMMAGLLTGCGSSRPSILYMQTSQLSIAAAGGGFTALRQISPRCWG